MPGLKRVFRADLQPSRSRHIACCSRTYDHATCGRRRADLRHNWGSIGSASRDGLGLSREVLKQALAIEFAERKIPFDTEVPCVIRYKGRQLSGEYYMDFVCYGDVVLEVKARSSTGPADQAQVLNYLASSDHSLALLLNFGTPRLEHKRFIWTRRPL